MKSIKKVIFPIVAASIIFIGCGDNDNNKTAAVLTSISEGVYSGYAEDANGKPVSLRVFVGNDENTQIRVLDFNDDQTLYSGTNQDADTTVFGDFTCEKTDTNITCNNFSLAPMSLSTLTLSNLDGTYKSADSARNIWSMVIANGAVTMSNDGDSCAVNGTLSLEDNSTIPFFTLTSSGCTEDKTYYGYGEMYSLSNTNDMINLLVADFAEITSHWTK